MEATFYLYRLFDSEYPEITRYVGCTDDPTRRKKQHQKLITGTGLIRPWAAYLAQCERQPQLEILKVLDCGLDAARDEELRLIEEYAVGNKWLLNGIQWRRDKIASGIPRGVVKAYLRCVNGVDLNQQNFWYMGGLSSVARDLERAFPRLRIYHSMFFRAAVCS
jgi:hypothetical protein